VNGTRLRVLVVDDEALVADYVADLVEEAGHDVVGIAATGERALAYLARDGVDLAILDIKLKGTTTGIDLAVEARRRAVPHVFITGSGDPATREAALATAPLDFLQKPLDQRRLREVLARAAGR
jgi:CheY-like chemotaxis protein